jgi:hypothetical protein
MEGRPLPLEGFQENQSNASNIYEQDSSVTLLDVTWHPGWWSDKLFQMVQLSDVFTMCLGKSISCFDFI